MEHARKMILVPEDSVEKLKKNSTHDVHHVLTELAKEIQPSAQTPGTNTSRLDAQLLEILNAKTPKDGHEKWKLYNDVLRRYLFYTQQSKVPVQETGTPDPEPDTRYDPKAIVATIPATFQRKALGILEYIDRVDTGRKLKWDARGQVTLNGQSLDGVNIVDLIQDVVRARKTCQAKGCEHFAVYLHSINTPREFMVNPKFHRLSQIPSSRPKVQREISEDESFEEEGGTPRSSLVHRTRRNLKRRVRVFSPYGKKEKKTSGLSSWLQF